MYGNHADNKKIYPSERITRIGSTSYFVCDTVGWANWFYVNGHLPRNTQRYAPSVLTIHNIEVSNKGIYECEGRTEDLGIFYAQAVLKVQGKSD